MADAGFRAGVVALLGLPNAGKSTLLNRLLGEKLAIVTHRPQTTRSRILGICTREKAQILLLDTPGLHASQRPLNAALNEQAEEAARDCDVALLLVDLTRGWQPEHAAFLRDWLAAGRSVVVAGTQLDRPGARDAAWPPPGVEGAAAALRVSARSGEGIESLLATLESLLPASPPLYPEDALTDRPLRFLAAERVREAAFEELEQEIPYALAVEVEEFDESRPGEVRIRANLLLERASQKKIAIGSGGAVIKRIGVRARRELRALLGCEVHLSLWVKLEPRWSRRPKRLKSLGYS